MNEDYFIDYIDIDFFLRVNIKFKMICCLDLILFYRLGEKKKVNVFLFLVVVLNYFFFCRYYIYCNRIDVWKNYYIVYFKYILYEVCVFVVEMFKILVLESNKKDNFFFIFKGIVLSFKKRFIK